MFTEKWIQTFQCYSVLSLGKQNDKQALVKCYDIAAFLFMISHFFQKTTDISETASKDNRTPVPTICSIHTIQLWFTKLAKVLLQPTPEVFLNEAFHEPPWLFSEAQLC